MFVHDTIGPAVRDIAVRDSVTLRLQLDRPLAVDQVVDTSLIALFTADSTPVPIVSVVAGFPADTADTPADSAVAPADTTPTPAAPVVSPPAAPADTADSTSRVPPPVPSRPAPVSQLQVRTAAPLEYGARYRIQLRDARNLLGYARTSDRGFEVPERDTTTRDTTAVDSAAVDSAAADSVVQPVPPPTPPPIIGARPALPPPSRSRDERAAPPAALAVTGVGTRQRPRRAAR